MGAERTGGNFLSDSQLSSEYCGTPGQSWL